MKTCFLYIAFLFFLLPAVVAGQEQDPYVRYLKENLDNRQFEKEKWEQAKEGLDFSEAAVKKKEPEAAAEPPGGAEGQYERPQQQRDHVQVNPELAAGILKFLAILSLAIVIALILRGVLGLESSPRNKKIEQEDGGNVISLEKIEENIHESDLEGYLRRALEQEEYALALRLYYLSILKELSLRKRIRWRREKTNRQYVEEMKQSPLSGAFEEATRIFERSWYGSRGLERTDYQLLEPKFRALAGKIKAGG